MQIMTSKRADLGALALFLALSAVVAGVSGAVTIASVQTWYATLNKPSFNPPNWLFGPVWTVLYTAMAIAAWRVWRSRRWTNTGLAFGLYASQMVLNFAWSLIFFGMHQVGLALLDIAALIVLVAATTLAFWRRDAVAGALLAPYLIWVSFAALLNFSILRLN